MLGRCGLPLVAALIAAFALGATSAAQGRASLGPTTTLNRDVVFNLATAQLLGPVSPAQQMTVGVVLSNPNSGAENAYLNSLYDPTSSNYEQFLDPGTFDQMFGVPASTVTAATSWLQAGGLSVTQPEGATTYLLATGSAAQVSALFGTPLNNYTAGGRVFYANAVAPSVPASLPVSRVLGLNNVATFTTPRRGATGTETYTTAPAPPTGTNVPNTGLLSPRTLWSIYDLPNSNLGNGQTMAIIGWGVTTPVVPDLRSFEAENDLPQVPITVKYYGDTSTPTQDDGSTVEWELDTQASTGMAPDVQGESLYFARHSTDAEILAAITAWVNDKHGPLQASASFGECENIPQLESVIGVDGLEGPGDQVLKQAAIEGRTLFSSTGDTGGSCPILPAPPVLGSYNGVATNLYPALNYPSASPYAVAVGGTVLSSDGGTPPKRFAEYAWEYGGGGNSTVETAGTYQQGVAKVDCIENQDGDVYANDNAPLCRSTPDVAAISGDVATNNGMLITDDNGADSQGAGTSLSSPLWLGFWTRIQAASRAKNGLGFANYSIYKAAQGPNYSKDFYDVTVGDNQPYPATPGYDNATGWGTPDVANLMQDLTGHLTPFHNQPPPVAAKSAPDVSGCGTLFTDPAGDDDYAPEGEAIEAPGSNPQLDILSGEMCLSPDGQTLRTIITVRNLTTTVPVGGAENDYNFVWEYDGTEYFTQLAVEEDGTVLAWDGQAIHASLETRFQQLHSDTGTITLGPDGTVEVDVPLANIGSPAPGSVLATPSAESYVREGVLAGSLEPADSAGPYSNFLIP
ncbi:MAG TPA: S53 family peptidase [Gaiellaceae bacterium]|nr:S53 family peptidase [Gaiellaceae bacterium]